MTTGSNKRPEPPSERPAERPAERPSGAGPAARPAAPKCTIEVIDPDDVLVLGLNDRWFRTFTTGSDRYPVQFDIPPGFLVDGWNQVVGNYTNVAVAGHKNDCSVEYRVLLDGQEVVHVSYKTDVHPQTFTIVFKDTFSSRARAVDRGRSTGRASGRFQDMMEWQGKGEGEGP